MCHVLFVEICAELMPMLKELTAFVGGVMPMLKELTAFVGGVMPITLPNVFVPTLFFDKSYLALSQLVIILYLWARDSPQKEIAWEATCSKQTVVDWWNFIAKSASSTSKQTRRS